MSNTINTGLTLQKLIEEIKNDTQNMNTTKIGMIEILSKIQEVLVPYFQSVIGNEINKFFDEINMNFKICNAEQIKKAIKNNKKLYHIELSYLYNNVTFIMCVIIKYNTENIDNIFNLPTAISSKIICVKHIDNTNIIRLYDEKIQKFINVNEMIKDELTIY